MKEITIRLIVQYVNQNKHYEFLNKLPKICKMILNLNLIINVRLCTMSKIIFFNYHDETKTPLNLQ